MRISTTIFFLLALSIATPPARAQQGSPDSQLREVRGSTVDKNERTVTSAVIYLQNVSTRTVNTQISDDKGQYHFSGLDGGVDYKLHAEYNDQTSSKHTISVFNRHKDMVIILKVDKNKKKTLWPKTSPPDANELCAMLNRRGDCRFPADILGHSCLDQSLGTV